MHKKKAPDKKKLKPASIEAQKAWAGFSPKLKKELRKTLPDTDRDRVPNGFDCRPRNKKKQESFLSADAVYLNSNPEIILGKKLGFGVYGDVYTLANNENLVVKVPRDFVKKPGMAPGKRRKRLDCISVSGIDAEAELYQNNNLEDEHLFIPTKIVDLGKGCPSDRRTYVGLVRPKVTPILGRKKGTIRRGVGKLTDSQLLELRNKLIDLSNKGYTFWDGLQLGVDASGRVLAYDVGGVSRYPLSDRATTFRVNNSVWFQFLENIGRDTDYERLGGALT